MIADLHACWPWMSARRIEAIVAQANALRPDLIALLGDYAAHILLSRQLERRIVAQLLSALDAPLGVWAVQGNHDWYDAHAVPGNSAPVWDKALEAVGIQVLENRWVHVAHGDGFTLAGLGSQRAYRRPGPDGRRGVDDLAKALAGADPAACTILLAHEPDVFADLPEGVDLTLSGHTHGGQIRVLGHAPVVPSRYGSRYAYGHIRERDRDLVVSGGLGCTTIPLRIGMPPEITVVEVS
ncbi:MAG: metallophosphoesterase [Pseudomonadota bacterium]